MNRVLLQEDVRDFAGMHNGIADECERERDERIYGTSVPVADPAEAFQRMMNILMSTVVYT